jgi:hypothetical protein
MHPSRRPTRLALDGVAQDLRELLAAGLPAHEDVLRARTDRLEGQRVVALGRVHHERRAQRRDAHELEPLQRIRAGRQLEDHRLDRRALHAEEALDRGRRRLRREDEELAGRCGLEQTAHVVRLTCGRFDDEHLHPKILATRAALA